MLHKIRFVFFFGATCSAYPSSKIFATSAWVWTRSNGPTDPLHLFHLEDTALLFLFLSESVKVRFLPRVDTFSSDMLFIVSQQCACSRRVHIEGYMNRGGFIWILVILENNSDNDSFGFFCPKKNTNRILCSAVSSKWNKCRGSVGPLERVQTHAEVAKILLDG
jgi:hypothetical protein